MSAKIAGRCSTGLIAHNLLSIRLSGFFRILSGSRQLLSQCPKKIQVDIRWKKGKYIVITLHGHLIYMFYGV